MRRGRDLDNPDLPELGHFERCQACGQLFDVRDLGQVGRIFMNRKSKHFPRRLSAGRTKRRDPSAAGSRLVEGLKAASRRESR